MRVHLRKWLSIFTERNFSRRPKRILAFFSFLLNIVLIGLVVPLWLSYWQIQEARKLADSSQDQKFELVEMSNDTTGSWAFRLHIGDMPLDRPEYYFALKGRNVSIERIWFDILDIRPCDDKYNVPQNSWQRAAFPVSCEAVLHPSRKEVHLYDIRFPISNVRLGKEKMMALMLSFNENYIFRIDLTSLKQGISYKLRVNVKSVEDLPVQSSRAAWYDFPRFKELNELVNDDSRVVTITDALDPGIQWYFQDLARERELDLKIIVGKSSIGQFIAIDKSKLLKLEYSYEYDRMIPMATVQEFVTNTWVIRSMLSMLETTRQVYPRSELQSLE